MRTVHGLSSVPLDLYDRDCPVRKHAPYPGARRDVFKARRSFLSGHLLGHACLSHLR